MLRHAWLTGHIECCFIVYRNCSCACTESLVKYCIPKMYTVNCTLLLRTHCNINVFSSKLAGPPPHGAPPPHGPPPHGGPPAPHVNPAFFPPHSAPPPAAAAPPAHYAPPPPSHQVYTVIVFYENHNPISFFFYLAW